MDSSQAGEIAKRFLFTKNIPYKKMISCECRDKGGTFAALFLCEEQANHENEFRTPNSPDVLIVEVFPDGITSIFETL